MANLREKFRGCLLGALIGDCLGSHFENASLSALLGVKKHIDNAENGVGEDIILTDDTQMTQELAKSLLEHQRINAKDLAKSFTERYFKDGANFYGAGVVEIFVKLRDTNYNDPLRPAREQFGGSGSYGNGAAMRVSPVPLFCFPDLEKTAETAQKSAMLTHTHVLGVHGAIFLALAIRRCLLTSNITNPEDFLDPFEADLKQVNICNEYLESLTSIREVLKIGTRVSHGRVIRQLGTLVVAERSVPTAVFIFLRALTPIAHFEIENGFRRTVEYAISLGGDTDTIASMAGAIAGAYYGQEAINENIIKSCPDHELAIQHADDFLALVEGATHLTSDQPER